MMNDFLKAAYKQSSQVIPQKSAEISGAFINVTADNSTHYSDGVTGGIEPDDRLVITALTSELPVTIKSLDGELIKVDGVEWRIERILHGDVLTNIDLINPDYAN